MFIIVKIFFIELHNIYILLELFVYIKKAPIKGERMNA